MTGDLKYIHRGQATRTHGAVSRDAFTLVELVCAVGIMTVLAALLLPAVARVRAMARQAQCATNLRQWGLSVNQYALQNDLWLPRRGQGIQPTGQITSYDDWFNELPQSIGSQRYVDLVSARRMPQPGDGSIWVCPELTGLPNPFGYLFGYSMNMALSVPVAPIPDKMNKVGPPSTMVFLTDGNPWFCSTLPYLSTAAAPALYNPVARHSGNLNICFLDGHVDAYAGSVVGVGAGDPGNPELRWYWYVPGPTAPWTGP